MVDYKELLHNWERFTEMLQKPSQGHDDLTAAMIKRYSDQNLEMLNEVLLSSLEHLQRLQKAKSLNDVICNQARLAEDISKKMLKTGRAFFNASFDQVSDYNEWLKAHCDSATD